MNKYKNAIINILNIIIIIVLIWILQVLDNHSLIAKGNIERIDLYRTLIRLNMLAIGIAIEGKRLFKGFRTTFSVNRLGLVLSMSMVILSTMPLLMYYVVSSSPTEGFSIHAPFGIILYIIVYGKSWNIISLLVGIGIVRSITEVE